MSRENSRTVSPSASTRWSPAQAIACSGFTATRSRLGRGDQESPDPAGARPVGLFTSPTAGATDTVSPTGLGGTGRGPHPRRTERDVLGGVRIAEHNQEI